MKHELSNAQRTCLQTMRRRWPNEWVSARDVGASIATLDALVTRGILVSHTSGLGSLFAPRVGRKYLLRVDDTPSPPTEE
jgi:hypothetical protein